MLKGHAIIKLTDVNTGKVEVHEHDNLITNAISENLTFASKILNTDATNTRYLPLNNKGMGGILLFESNLTEGATNTAIPSVFENAITGYASNNAYISTDLKRGSRNSAESEELSNGYKYVWDFSTSQANGIIGAVALTSAKTGASPFSYNTSGSFDTTEATSNERYIMNFDFDTNVFTNVYLTGDRSVTVRKKRLPIDKIRINTELLKIENVGDPVRYDYNDSGITFNEDSAVIDSNDEYYYIAYCAGVALTVCRIRKDDYSIDVDFGLKNFTLEESVVLNYTKKNAVVMYNKIYIFQGYKMHSINLYDIHMKFVNNMEYSVSGAVAILGDSIVTNSYILYVGLDSSYRVVPKSGYKNGVISDQNSLNLLVFDNGIVFEVYNPASTYQINIGSTFDYLATINNLDTPIEKTSAQTMKITYTLTEV